MILGIGSANDSLVNEVMGNDLIRNESINLDSDKIAVSQKKMNETYTSFLENYYKSKNVLYKSDTLDYLLKKLKHYLTADTIPFNDSIMQATEKVELYVANRDIKPVMDYFKDKIEIPNFPFDTSGYYTQLLNDSVKSTLSTLIDLLSQNSIELVFNNTQNEEELLLSSPGSNDSIHVNIYDQRGEFAVLWIKRKDNNILELYLEDGTYIEKTRQRSTIQREIKTKKSQIKLQEVKQINIVLPQWTFNGSINLNFSQSYLSDWAAGGENSLSALSVLRYSADLVYGKKIWDNDIEYKLGYLKAGDGPLQKNDDKFEFNSKYGHAAFNHWYYSVLLNFKTQFLTGYDYPKDADPVANSGFLSPAFLVFSLGLDYKPSNNLTLLLSPLTSKFTIFTDTASYDQTRFGVDKDKKSKQEIGAYIKLLSKVKLRKDILLENRVNLFTNYVDNPQNVDIDWEAILNFELNEYFRFTLNTHIIYDDNIDIPVYENIDGVKTKVGVTKKLQWKEVFSVGFIYKIYH